MTVTASNTVHCAMETDTFRIVNLTPEPHFIHITSVWMIIMMIVSGDIRHILAFSFLKSEHYGQIHIISGLSGQVLTIGQCPQPGGSSLTIIMTCNTLNCSRIVSCDQLEQFK